MGMRYGYPEPPWTYSPKEVGNGLMRGTHAINARKQK